MPKLKLINAERYVAAPLGVEPILKGQTVEVDDAVATELLKDVRMDSLNNEHPVWKDVSDEPDEAAEAGEDDEQGEDGAPRAKKATTPRAAARKGK